MVYKATGMAAKKLENVHERYQDVADIFLEQEAQAPQSRQRTNIKLPSVYKKTQQQTDESVEQAVDGIAKYYISIENAKKNIEKLVNDSDVKIEAVTDKNFNKIKDLIGYIQGYVSLGGDINELNLNTVTKRRFEGNGMRGTFSQQVLDLKESIVNAFKEVNAKQNAQNYGSAGNAEAVHTAVANEVNTNPNSNVVGGLSDKDINKLIVSLNDIKKEIINLPHDKKDNSDSFKEQILSGIEELDKCLNSFYEEFVPSLAIISKKIVDIGEKIDTLILQIPQSTATNIGKKYLDMANIILDQLHADEVMKGKNVYLYEHGWFSTSNGLSTTPFLHGDQGGVQTSLVYNDAVKLARATGEKIKYGYHSHSGDEKAAMSFPRYQNGELKKGDLANFLQENDYDSDFFDIEEQLIGGIESVQVVFTKKFFEAFRDKIEKADYESERKDENGEIQKVKEDFYKKFALDLKELKENEKSPGYKQAIFNAHESLGGIFDVSLLESYQNELYNRLKDKIPKYTEEFLAQILDPNNNKKTINQQYNEFLDRMAEENNISGIDKEKLFSILNYRYSQVSDQDVYNHLNDYILKNSFGIDGFLKNYTQTYNLKNAFEKKAFHEKYGFSADTTSADATLNEVITSLEEIKTEISSIVNSFQNIGNTDSLGNINQELDELKNKTNETKQDIDSLKEKVIELSDAFNKLQDSEKLSDNLESQVDGLTENVVSFNSKIKKTKDDIQDLGDGNELFESYNNKNNLLSGGTTSSVIPTPSEESQKKWRDYNDLVAIGYDRIQKMNKISESGTEGKNSVYDLLRLNHPIWDEVKANNFFNNIPEQGLQRYNAILEIVERIVAEMVSTSGLTEEQIISQLKAIKDSKGGYFKANGNDSGWSHFATYSDGTSKDLMHKENGLTYKVYASFDDVKDLNQNVISSLMDELSKAGFKGRLKTTTGSTSFGDRLNALGITDQLVVHGATKQDQEIAYNTIKKYLGSKLSYLGGGIDTPHGSFSETLSSGNIAKYVNPIIEAHNKATKAAKEHADAEHEVTDVVSQTSNKTPVLTEPAEVSDIVSLPTQEFDNEIQQNLVMLENYENTLKEIDKLKLEPETEETKHKIEELNKLADYFASRITAIRSENNEEINKSMMYFNGFPNEYLRNHYTSEQIKDFDKVASERAGLNINNVSTEFSGIGQEIQNIESKSETLRHSLNEALSESRDYVKKLSNGLLDYVDSALELRTMTNPKDIQDATNDINYLLKKYPELEQFKDKFTSYGAAKDFVKSDEWNDFLATLPKAHTYLEELGYDFERLNKSSNGSNLSSDTSRIAYHAGWLNDEIMKHPNSNSLGVVGVGHGGIGRNGGLNLLTGLYLSSNPEDYIGDDWDGKPISEIDISKYNLFVAKTEESAEELKNFFDAMDGVISGEVNVFDEDGPHKEKNLLSINDLYQQFCEVFNDKILEFNDFEKFIKDAIDLFNSYDFTSQSNNNSIFGDHANIYRDYKLPYRQEMGSLYTGLPKELLDEDTFATKLLKMLGFEGVDTSRTSYGGIEGGTILFEIKPDSVIKQNGSWSDFIKKSGYGDYLHEGYEEKEKIQTELAQISAMSMDSIRELDESLLPLLEIIEAKHNISDGLIDRVENAKSHIENNDLPEDEIQDTIDFVNEFWEIAEKSKEIMQNGMFGDATAEDIGKYLDSKKYGEYYLFKSWFNGDSVSDTINSYLNQTPVLTETDEKFELDSPITVKVHPVLDSEEIAEEITSQLSEESVKFDVEPIVDSEELTNENQLEKTDIEELGQTLDDITRKIGLKTAAFVNEQGVVEKVVNVEKAKLSELKDAIDAVTKSVDAKTKAFENESSVVANAIKAETKSTESSKAPKIKTTKNKDKDDEVKNEEKRQEMLRKAREAAIKDYGLYQLKQKRLKEKEDQREQERKNNKFADYQNQYNKLSDETNIVKYPKEYQRLLSQISEKINNINKLNVIEDDDLNQLGNLFDELQKVDKLASGANVSNYITKIERILQKNSKLGSGTRTKFESFINDLKNPELTQDAFRKIVKEVNELEASMIRAGEAGKGIFRAIKEKAFWRTAQYIASFFSFQDWIRYAKQAINTVIELDTALVDLRKTTKMSNTELDSFYHNSSNIAKQLGVTTKEIISQASAWSRLGFNTADQSEKMAMLSSQFASISPDMDVSKATDGLVSSMKAFGIEVDDVERNIMDNINKIGNTMATTNGEIVDMLERSSAAMSVANNTIQETIALESAAVEITRNAETTGTAFKTLSMRIRGYDEETEELSDDLKDISGVIADLTKVSGKGGVSLFTDSSKTTYKSTYQILKEIAERWDQISDKNQAALLEKLAGKRGGQVVGGLLTNFDAVEKAMQTMEQAAGSADAEMSIIKESIEFKINAFKQTWVGVAQELIDRGDIGKIVDGFTKISEAIGFVVEKAGLLGTIGGAAGAVAGFKNLGRTKMFVLTNMPRPIYF